MVDWIAMKKKYGLLISVLFAIGILAVAIMPTAFAVPSGHFSFKSVPSVFKKSATSIYPIKPAKVEDTVPPTLLLSHTPEVLKIGDTLRITGAASDNVQVKEIQLYFTSAGGGKTYSTKKCSIGSKTGTCTLEFKIAEYDDYAYGGHAYDSSGNSIRWVEGNRNFLIHQKLSLAYTQGFTPLSTPIQYEPKTFYAQGTSDQLIKTITLNLYEQLPSSQGSRYQLIDKKTCSVQAKIADCKFDVIFSKGGFMHGYEFIYSTTTFDFEPDFISIFVFRKSSQGGGGGGCIEGKDCPLIQ